MCSIIAGYNPAKVKELIEINQFRGNFSYSYTEIDNKHDYIQSSVKDFGKFDFNVINQQSEYNYKICHVQAPTGGLVEDKNRIHPTVSEKSSLWHNGLLTPRGIKFLQQKLNTTETFDTKLLHMALDKFDFDILSEIEGLFSCLYVYDGQIYIFRTKHGKLFIDDDMNVSSERFENSRCINANTIYALLPWIPDYAVITEFKTKRFNFVIPGEM